MAPSLLIWVPLALFTAFTHLVSADIEFTTPKAGAKLTGGSAIVVEWKDSGDEPALSDLLTYQLFISAGGNDQGEFIDLLEITQGATTFSVTGNKATGTIGSGIGASTPNNAYFLKMVSVGKTGGQVINYSSRFSLSGMVGTFPQSVIDGMKTVTGTDGPARVDNTGDAAQNPAAGGDYGVEYTMQTGLTRYAPMQPVPATKITKKKATPQHPTSAFTIAKTFMGTPNVATTLTQSQTYSVSSRENTAAAAPMPSDDMAKFLARWKD